MNYIMVYAIEHLEQIEEILKDLIENSAEHEIKEQKYREKLYEVQLAILVINGSRELLNIGQIQALKLLNK